jgi:hypothetical protein
MSTNYGLTGRFAQKKRAKWPQTTLAVAYMVAASLFMAYVFAGAMR